MHKMKEVLDTHICGMAGNDNQVKPHLGIVFRRV